MNTVQLIGRLTADPKADTTPTGKSVCRIRLAVPGFNRDATPVFIDVEAWNKLAEACDKHLEKGRRVSVTGRIAHDQWETEDGQKRQRHYVVADNVEFLDARKNGVQVEAQPELEAASCLASSTFPRPHHGAPVNLAGAPPVFFPSLRARSCAL